MNEKKSLRTIALGLIADGDGFEVQPGLTLIKTVFGGAIVKEGERDLADLTPDEMNAILTRAAAAEDGYLNPENSPIQGE